MERRWALRLFQQHFRGGDVRDKVGGEAAFQGCADRWNLEGAACNAKEARDLGQFVQIYPHHEIVEFTGYRIAIGID